MSRYYYHLKPEAALNNAEDMIKVGKKEAALECLAELMRSRRLKNLQQASNKVLEEVMRRISTLCVEMRNTSTFKEVVHQYKNMIASVNPKSLEDVVLFYLTEAKAKTDEARNESRALVVDVEDLETIETPESLMMRSVSMEGAQERSDRTILAPWLRFLWESYRMVLELLRNNKKFERLYHNVAQEVFKMCIQFTRKAEFRKLCDWLRKDLGRIQAQLATQTSLPSHAVNLSNADTQAMHLETRLEQLDCAFVLEQFSEAYKTIEDIWNLISLNKKMAKPSFMSKYYMQLAEIFYRCDTMLFHAATLVKHFLLVREMRKNMVQEELHVLASRVYCAILAIPLTGQREHNLDYALDGNESLPPYKQKILSNVIGLSTPPTREQLLKDLVRLNIHHQAHSEISKLYQYMEVDFHPLQMNRRVRPALEFIADQPTLKPYLQSLQNILVVRTLLQCSQVYQCLRMDKFVDLCATSQVLNKRGEEAAQAENEAADAQTPPSRDRQLSLAIENIIVSNVYQLELPVRLDLREGTLRFNVYNDLGIGTHQLDSSTLLSGPSTEMQQSLWPISESVCGQLVGLCCALHQVVDKLEPMERNVGRVRAIDHAIQGHRQGGERHHKNLLDRKTLIEERKVAQEAYFDQMTRQEQQKRELADQRLKEAEKQRREKEQRDREMRKMEEQKRQIDEQVKKERLMNIMGKGLTGVSEANIASMNPDELLVLEREEQKRQLIEKFERTRLLERKQDYLTRALNTEEQPLLHKEADASPQIALDRFEEAHRSKLEKAKKEHAAQLEDKDRLSRMAKYVGTFLAEIHKESEDVFKKALAEWEAECNEERERQLQKRREERKEERKAAYLKRKREERERIEREKREEEERMRAEEQRNKFKQALGGAVQTTNEALRETERKPFQAPVFVAGASAGGGWREREAKKKIEWTGEERREAHVPDGVPRAHADERDQRTMTPAGGPARQPVGFPSRSGGDFQRGGSGAPRTQTPAGGADASSWRRPNTTPQDQRPQPDRGVNTPSGMDGGSWRRGGGQQSTQENAPPADTKPSLGGKPGAYVPPNMRQPQQSQGNAQSAPTPQRPAKEIPQTDSDGWSTVGSGKRMNR